MGDYEIVEKIAKRILKYAREYANSSGLNPRRLPDWVKSAKVLVGKVYETYVFLFQPSSTNKDKIIYKGQIKSDLCLFLDLPDLTTRNVSVRVIPPMGTVPGNEGIIFIGGGEIDREKTTFTLDRPLYPLSGWTLTKREGRGRILFRGEGKKITTIIFDFTGLPEMFDLSKEEVNAPIFLANFFMRYKPEGVAIAVGFVPFAAMIHENDLAFNEYIFDICQLRVEDVLNYTHNTPIGDYYEYKSNRESILRITLEKSVIVLGSYKDKWKHELEQIRDYLKTEGYDSALLEELPEHPVWTQQEKVNFWTNAARFCVVVDREASGHLTEFEVLKHNRTITALLRSRQGGSTWMIGDEPLADYNFIRVFEFEKSPLEVIGEAVRWSESLVKERIKQYKKYYPWYKNSNVSTEE